MCNECGIMGCTPTCPNYEPVVIYKCEVCESDICEYESYFELELGVMCMECVEERTKIARRDEY